MNKETSLEQILSDVILFFDRNKQLIISMTLVAVLGVFLFQNLKPAFYKTTAIVTSGISEYEGIKIQKEDDVRNQRMAINLINDLQLDIEKEDYVALQRKLTKLTVDEAKQIKFIEAEPLLRQDKDEKFHNTSDFQINLLVRDANIIEDIEESLEYYFNETNHYTTQYWIEFKRGYRNLINATDLEISSLKKLRESLLTKEKVYSNSNSATSSNSEELLTNEIFLLNHKKMILERDLKLIKPLNFAKPFTQTTVAERQVLVWGSAIGFLAFILSTIVAVIKETKQKALKETK